MPQLPGGGLPQRHGRVTVAVTHGPPPQVFIAEDYEVLGRMLGLQLVAAQVPEFYGANAPAVRQALLDEQWAEALLMWMSAARDTVDVYPDEVVWGERDASAEQLSFEIRMTRLFREPSE